MQSRPFPLVIAAPSGAGKTSIAHALVDRHEDIVFSISATTRPARGYEGDGVDYWFVDDAEFDRMTDTGELVEWAQVHGHRYGTPARGIAEGLARSRIVVLDIDVQGARQIRRRFPDAVLVFILPPSGHELGRRLAGRGSERDAEIRRRLDGARRELPAAAEFDYIVVNDDLERAVAALESILEAERHRWNRLENAGAELAKIGREVDEILNRSE